MTKIDDRKRTLVPALQLLLLVAVSAGIFANGFDHDFNLDSRPGIVKNDYYRSLNNIPLFFKDPLTLTSVRANGDYRPVLQTTFTLNYLLSDLDMWSWHLVQILLHMVCVLSVLGLGRRIIAQFYRNAPPSFVLWVPFVSALIFSIHPVHSGVINYLWARSSLLVSAFLLPAFLLYLGPVDTARSKKAYVGAWLLFTLALFSKVEAIAAIAVFFICDMIRAIPTREDAPVKTTQIGLLRDLLSKESLHRITRMWPFLAIAAIYLVIRQITVPDFLSETRHTGTVSSYEYFATQLVACWYYLGKWLLPTNLIADNFNFTVYRSLTEPAVFGAIVGYGVVVLVCAAAYRRHPETVLLTVAALALISPTSSFLPLAEMVNEHRPYLPRAILWIAIWIPAARWLWRVGKRRAARRVTLIAALCIATLVLGWTTWTRNQVFLTQEAYWRDALNKAPSARSALNLGVQYMAKEKYDDAEKLFLHSLKLAPNWHYTHINLGIMHREKGDYKKALHYFDLAVKNDLHSTLGRFHRGNLLLLMKRYKEARVDLLENLTQGHHLFTVHKGLVKAAAGLGDLKAALKHTRAAFEIAPAGTEAAIVDISTPFWNDPNLYPLGIEYYREISSLFPDRWWIKENIARLEKKRQGAKSR